MATTLTSPQTIGQPWATGGDKATLPETSAAAGVASLNEGIPSECSLPISGGGSYVRRTDVNALGYLTTSLNFFLQNGGSFTYDAGVATAIGGYPAGALLRYTDSDGNVSIVRSMINNNTNNFVTDPTKIDGTNWEIVIAGNEPWSKSTTLTTKNALLATNGFQKLPSGLILQWGMETNCLYTVTRVVTFPIPFTVACFFGEVSPTTPPSAGGGAAYQAFTDRSTTNFVFINTDYTTANFNWFAIGY